MNPAEIRFIRKAFISETLGGFLEKSARPPSCESSLMSPLHLVQLLAIRILNANGGHSSVCGLFLLLAVVGNGAMNKFGTCSQRRRELFTIRKLLFFSVGNGDIGTCAMNGN